MLTPYVPAYLTANSTTTRGETSSCSCTYCLEDFGPIDTAANVTETILAAVAEVGALGGGVICFPNQTLSMDALEETAVDAHEGAAVVLTDEMSNITFLGNRTTLRPVSNAIEMFVINGAENTVFENFIFDNSDNGVLQDQFKPAVKVIGGGIAGLGNATNCAIRQYSGANLTVRDCRFIEFHTAVGYTGNYTDDQVLSGTVTIDGQHADGCVFGLLTEQPEEIRYVNSAYINGINSVNAVGSVNNADPGHGLYVANRPGARPYSIIVDNIILRGNQSYGIKVRKGIRPVISNITDYGSHCGLNIENCEPIVSNVNIKLANLYPGDTRAMGMKLVNIGNSKFTNCAIDISGCDAWAVKVQATVDLDGTDPETPEDTNPSAEDFWNVNNQLDGISMVNDLVASVDKRWLVAQNQVDILLKDVVAYVTTNTTSDKPVVYIDNCVRSHVQRPKRRTAGASNPSGSDRLVGITATGVNTRVEYSRADLDVAPTANTINIDPAATGTIVERVDGLITGTWVPAPTFATVGNFAATNVTTTGSWYTRRGPEVTVSCRLKFDCTQTTASGAFRITGFPYAANGFSNEFVSAVGMHKNFTLASGDVGVVIGNGETFFTLRTNAAGGAGVGPLVAGNLPTTANVEVGFEITFRITEP